ncbi:MAG: putative oxidoreductase, Rieske [2Fe-2S] region [Acidimicrobiia bacterium]|nr:putative oxidoreductase, Rieske [2Fe-2S] region [Acidimicrobiia bacterium]
MPTANPLLANDDPGLRRAWHPVARSSEVGAHPHPVTLLGQHWVLVRLPAGLAAYVDRCPHRLAPLSAGWVDGDVLRCGYHGWCFDQAGQCTEIPSMGLNDGKRPARANASTPWAVAELGGLIFIAPDEPVTELLAVPEAGDPSFMHGHLEVMTARVGAGLLIDNFLDMTHFPYVHANTIGTEESAVPDEAEIDRRPFAMTVRSRHPFPNHEDPEVVAGRRPLLQHRRLVYEYRAPFSASLRIDYEEAGGCNMVEFFVQPVDADTCRIYTSIHRNDLGGDENRLAECLSFEQKILDEDLRLQERFFDRRLPLDLTVEVHVKADRVTVELRRILAELVATVG